MVQAANTELKLVYEGSVKRVYAPATSGDHLWFHFTDDYSVFDWGKMPDTICNKGRALTLMGAYFFERLQQKGIRSHYKGLVEENDELYLEVLRADVHRPQCVSVLGQSVYYYAPVPASSRTRLVPLEVVFRFGMPSGSSLKERLQKDPDYARVLGLKSIPAEGSWFEKPVLEFFTKLEPKDRLLSLPEAMAISGITGEQFQSLCELALKAATELFSIFKEQQIELWDGKFEFIIFNDELLLADSIGPDELRLIYKDVHLSKEIIRQVYRGTAWEKALKEAQKIARERGNEDWKRICVEELGQQPERLPVEFKEKIDHLYSSLADTISGKQFFASEPDLETLVTSLKDSR